MFLTPSLIVEKFPGNYHKNHPIANIRNVGTLDVQRDEALHSNKCWRISRHSLDTKIQFI